MSGSGAFGGSTDSLASDRAAAGWHSRPVVAGFIRLLVFALPIASAIVVVRVSSPALPHPRGLLGWTSWLFASAAIALATVTVVDRFARRLLPLATLFHMSLVFPDETPSRMKLALRSGTARDLQRRIADGETLGATADEAAQNLLLLLRLLNDHDRLTRGHSERVRAFADLIAEEMDLPAEDRALLHWGALAHDVGKLSVAPELLNKEGKPTDEEWRQLRNHPLAAFELAAPLRPWLGSWVDAATQHHERFDGGGYPLGLSGSDIHLSGRIVAVADAFDTMTSARSYKRPLPFADARAELTRNAGTQFDPEVVRAFMAVGVRRLRLVAGPLVWITSLPTATAVTTVTTTSGGAGAAIAGAALAVSTVVGLGVPADDSVAPEASAGVERVIDEATTESMPGETDVDVSPSTIEDSAAPTTSIDGSSTSTVAPTTSAPSTTTVGTSSTTTSAAPTTTTTSAAPTTTTTSAAPTTTTTNPPGTGLDCGAVQGGFRPLVGLDLINCDLSGLDLAGEDLRDADMDGADLSGAILSNALLRDGDYADVQFTNADLRGADMRNSEFDGSFFTNADLTDALLGGSNVEFVDFTDALLIRASLNDTGIRGSDFTRARLTDATGTPNDDSLATWANTECPNGVVQSTNCYA